MKNVSRTIKFVVLPFLAIALMLGFRAFAAGTDDKKDVQAPYVLKVHAARKLKKDDGGSEFAKVLDKNSHIYCMKYHKAGDVEKNDKKWNKKCPDAASSTSADSVKTGEYTLICSGAHVTQSAGFMTQQAMKTVEDLLE